MDKSPSLAAAALTTLIGLSLGSSADTASAQMPGAGDKEKCYGVVKKGQNDCGTANHGCSKQASQDGDPSEWIYLPKGSCEKIVGGSLEPKDK